MLCCWFGSLLKWTYLRCEGTYFDSGLVQTGKATKGEHEVEEITRESEGTPGESGRKGTSASYAL